MKSVMYSQKLKVKMVWSLTEKNIAKNFPVKSHLLDWVSLS